MHGTLTRRTLSFPGLNPNGGNSAYGIPDPRARAAALDTCSADEATINPGALTTYEIASQRLDIQAGTVAIGIAPDSLVACCDIAIDGSPVNAIRVSPENPLLGCRANGKATVTVPAIVPVLVVSSNNCAPGAVKFPYDGGEAYAWPLRLELHQGETMPMRATKRAPMVAAAKFVTANAATRIMYACVDGRARISVRVRATTANVTVKIYALGGVAGGGDETALALDDLGTTTGTITAGAGGTIYAFDGPPACPVIKVLITGTGAGTAIVECRAEDGGA